MKLLIIIFVLIEFGNCLVQKYPEIFMNITQLIAHNGYPVEVHDIISQGGYILKTFRIPHGRNSNTTNKNPIMLVHGMGGCSENFITMGKDDAIAYNLADAGYDVWLTNTRGNFHSRSHLRLDPDKDKEFWMFTFHEVGVYDMPATIDYILNETNETGVSFLGHSQGGTVYFIMLSERPEYGKKIKLSIQFAPSVVFKFINSPIGTISAILFPISERLYEIFNIYEIYPHNTDLMRTLEDICSSSEGLRFLCTTILYVVGGYDTHRLNETITQYILSTCPSGISAKNTIHYLQSIYYGCLRKYDFGLKKNLQVYKRDPPPLYNLINDIPIAVIYGTVDWLVPAEGAKELIKILPNVVWDFEIEDYNHIDFIFAKNVKETVNIPTIKFLDKFLKRI